MGTFKVLLYEDMHEEGKAILREKAEIFFAEGFEEAYLIERVKEMEGIILRANGEVNRRIMEAAPRLKVVGKHGVGVENIDVEAATERRIWVVNTPGCEFPLRGRTFLRSGPHAIRQVKCTSARSPEPNMVQGKHGYLDCG